MPFYFILSFLISLMSVLSQTITVIVNVGKNRDPASPHLSSNRNQPNVTGKQMSDSH